MNIGLWFILCKILNLLVLNSSLFNLCTNFCLFYHSYLRSYKPTFRCTCFIFDFIQVFVSFVVCFPLVRKLVFGITDFTNNFKFSCYLLLQISLIDLISNLHIFTARTAKNCLLPISISFRKAFSANNDIQVNELSQQVDMYILFYNNNLHFFFVYI